MPLQEISDGTRLHYAETGEGLPTLVPCLASSVPFERSVGAELGKEGRFIFVEARGTGRSEGSNEDTSIDRLVDDLEDLRERLGLSRVAVMGQSANGLVAARYAQKYPEALSHAVVIASPCPWPHDEAAKLAHWEARADEERRRVASTQRATLESEGIDPTTNEGTVSLFSLYSHEMWHDPSYDMAWMWDADLIGAATVWRTLEEWKGFDLREALMDTKVPVFAAYGRDDFHITPPTALEGIPGVSLEMFENSGHFAYFEEEQEFARRYRAWVERQ